MISQPDSLRTFRVRLGHVEIQVQARDVQEAVAVARRKLGRELPRLYDVIRQLAPAQFQVDYAAPSGPAGVL